MLAASLPIIPCNFESNHHLFLRFLLYSKEGSFLFKGEDDPNIVANLPSTP